MKKSPERRIFSPRLNGVARRLYPPERGVSTWPESLAGLHPGKVNSVGAESGPKEVRAAYRQTKPRRNRRKPVAAAQLLPLKPR